MKSLKKALAILLSAMTVFTSIPISAISAFAGETDDTVVCYACEGSGYTDCKICNGTGTIKQDCEKCEDGKVYSDCNICAGTGFVEDAETNEQVPCPNEECVDGKIIAECADCNGLGYVVLDCSECEDGHIACTVCNGTGEIKLVDDDGFDFVNSEIGETFSVQYESGKQFSMKAASSNQTNNNNVSYFSSETSVATIDDNGMITIVGAGKTNITATIASDNKIYKETSITCDLTIEKGSQQISIISPVNNAITCGDTFPLVIISDSENQDEVEFSIDNASKEYVDLNSEDKTITVKKATPAGTEITVTASLPENENYNEAEAKMTFTAVKANVDNFGFENSYPNDIAVGETFSNPVNIENGNVSYEIIEGTDLATLNGSKLTAEKPGTVKVRAKLSNDDFYNDAVAEYSINIIDKSSNALKFENSSSVITIPFGFSYKNALLENGSAVDNAEYKSSNSEVAVVDKNGNITTVKPGNTVITADINGQIVQYELVVTKANQPLEFSAKTAVVGYGEKFTFDAIGGDTSQEPKFSLSSDAGSFASITSDGTLSVSALSTNNSAILVTASKEESEYYYASSVSCQVVITKKALNVEIEKIDVNGEVVYKADGTYDLEFSPVLPSEFDGSYRMEISEGKDCAQIVDENKLKTIKPGKVEVVCTFSSENYYIAPVIYSFEIVKADQNIFFNDENVNLEYGVPYGQKAVVNEGSDNQVVYNVADNKDGIIDSVLEDGTIVFADQAVGSATISATIAGNDYYNEAKAEYTVSVKYADTPEIPYTISPELTANNEWYNSQNSPVKICAPENYLISSSNSLNSTNSWSSEIKLDTDGIYNEKVYLKNTNGGITDSVSVEQIKIDNTAPDQPTINIKTYSESGDLINIFASILFGYTAKVTLSSNDPVVGNVNSGVVSFEYDIRYLNGTTEHREVEAKDGQAVIYFEDDNKSEFKIVNVIAKDAAGNSSAAVSEDGTVVIIDQSAANITPSYSATDHVVYDEEDNNTTYYYGVEDLTKLAQEEDLNPQQLSQIVIKFNYDEENFDSSCINEKDSEGQFINNGCSIKVSKNGAQAEYIDRENLWFNDNDQTVTYMLNVDMAEHMSDGEYVFYVDYKDKSDNVSNQLVTSKIVVDTVSPVVSVSSNYEAASYVDETTQQTVYYKDENGYLYYTKGESSDPLKMEYTVTEKNINESGFSLNGVVSSYDSEEETEMLNTFSNFTSEKNDVIKSYLEISNEARYDYIVDITDLAGNKAVMYSNDGNQTETVNISEVKNKIVYDNTAPDIRVEIEEPSLGERILQGITFGIFKANATVVVSATDNISDIYSISYEAYIQDGASQNNTAIDKKTLTYEDTEFNELIGENKGEIKLEFKIAPQFRGFIKAEATTFGDLSASYDSGMEESPYGVIVDNQAPVGTLEIGSPTVVLDTNNEVVSYSSLSQFINSSESNDCRFVYSDPFEVTIYISEDNFNLNSEDGQIIADDETVIGDDESKLEVGTVVTINGQELKDLTWEKAQKVPDESISQSSTYKTTIQISEEGYYVLEVQSVDLAGNQMDTIKKVFTLDDTAPEITSFKISTDGNYYYKDKLVTDNESHQEILNATNNNNSGSVNNTTDENIFGNNRYDYYFTEYTEIEISAKDLFVNESTDKEETVAKDDAKEENQSQIAVNQKESGVKEIILLVQDCTKDSWTVVEPIDTTTTNNSDMVCTFEVEGPFKGNFFAIPIDRCGHYPYSLLDEIDSSKFNWSTREEYKDDIQYILNYNDMALEEALPLKNSGLNDGAGFVAPYDIVIENNDKHSNHSSISISYNDLIVETERDRDRFIDENRINSIVGDISRDQTPDFVNTIDTSVPLFKNDIDVTINIKDDYSGIRSVDLYVLGRDGQDTENNIHEKLNINNNAKLENATGWSIENADTSSNLVYEVKKTITVKNDSNDIIILAVLTDRSGNKSYDYNVIGIDKTAPNITLSYSDNSVRTGNYNEVYNHSRVATITVSERNFDTSYITAILNNMDKAYAYVPNIKNITDESAWTSNNDINNPVYTYTIRYTSNGDFQFRISLNDAAGNASNIVTSSFTIDLIKPHIDVLLDSNNNVQNGKYFNQNRTATIIVTEHNFNQKEFENLLKASLNGQNVTIPTVSGFNNTGNDTWTATVVFDRDGDYLLDFAYTDMAGNRYEAVQSDYQGTAAIDFTIDKTAPVIEIDVNDRYSYIDGPVVNVTEKDNNCSDVTTYMNGTVYDNGSFKTIRVNSSNTTMRQDHHNSDFVVTYEKITEDGYYRVEASCVDMAGNKSNTVSKVFTKNEFGSVYALSSDLKSVVDEAYVNKEKYFADKSENIYIDEYSPVPISLEDSEFYININSKRQNDCISRIEMTTVDGWYMYRYVLDNSKLAAEGVYTVYLRSTSNMASGSVTNNAQEASDNHRINIKFTVDNTNPYVKIDGLGDHINNRTSEKVIKLTVSDNNLYRIKAIVNNGVQSTTYVWVANPSKYEKQDPSEIVGSFLPEGSQDASLVEVSFPLSLSKAESTAQYDIRLEISDLAGNYAKNADDYNKDELFTDAYGRLNYILDSNSEGADSIFNYLEFSEITLSRSFAIGQMIRDNQPVAIAIFVAAALLLFLIIIIPILVKRRKKLDEQDSSRTE